MATSSFIRHGIIYRSWEMIWRHKLLWFFGLFAAILSFGEEYDLLVRNSDILGTIPQRLEQFRELSDQNLVTNFWHQLNITLRTQFGDSLTLIFTWLAAIISIAWLVTVSQAALIEGIRRAEEGKKYNLIEGFDVGMQHFWPIFLLNVIAKIVVYGGLLILVVPLALTYFQTGNPAYVIAIMLWTLVILVPVITIISFLFKFASSYIVLKGYTVRQAIPAAWRLFTRHWLVTLEIMAVLVIINYVAVSAITSTLIIWFGFPDLTPFELLLMFFCFGLAFAILTTFQFAVWTNLFFRLQEGHAPSKLRRLLHNILDIRETSSKPAPARR